MYVIIILGDWASLFKTVYVRMVVKRMKKILGDAVIDKNDGLKEGDCGVDQVFNTRLFVEKMPEKLRSVYSNILDKCNRNKVCRGNKSSYKYSRSYVWLRQESVKLPWLLKVDIEDDVRKVMNSGKYWCRIKEF